MRIAHGTLMAAALPILLIGGVQRVEAQSAGDVPAIQRPAFSPILRQNENWSVFAAGRPADGGDFWDPIKYVPLSDDGEIWASFGGQGRLRFEHFNNFNFVSDNDDNYALWRARLHGDLHFGKNVRVFAEGKSAWVDDRDLPGGARTLDTDTADILQLFVDVAVPLDDAGTLTFRTGRQMLLFGRQRLVSPLDWSNTIRSWDGVSAIWKTDRWTVTGFWTEFTPVQKYEFNDRDEDDELFGIYATAKLPGDSAWSIDLYWLGHDKEMAAFNGSAGEQRRQTFGGRLWGPIGDTPFDFEIEGAYQGGEIGGDDIDAFMLATVLGYTFRNTITTPRAYLGFDYASGDSTPGGDSETFSQLFPLGHAYLGYIDTVGRQNIIDASSGIEAKLHEQVTAALEGHLFWLAENGDAFYNAGGGIVRPAGASDDHYVGSEIDLTINYKHDRHTSFLFGYSHFFAGEVLDDTAGDADTDFFYVQVQYTF